MKKNNPWKTIGSKEVYKNSWIRVREDQVIRPDGQEGIYGVVEIKPSVAVIALDEKKKIVLVGQWRYPLDRYSWEIPTGCSNDGEDILAAAKRELSEETGIKAKNWQPLGLVDNCNGVTTDAAQLFLATDLTNGDNHPDNDEEIKLKWLDLDRAVKMVFHNEITEANSIAAILKLKYIIENSINI